MSSLKLIVLGLVVIPILVWGVSRNLNLYKQAQQPATINFLEYFLPSDSHNGLSRCDQNNSRSCIGLFKSDNKLIIDKWYHDPSAYEYFTWDNQYVHLIYDSSWGASGCQGMGTSYSFTNALWAKLNMVVGEEIVSTDNLFTAYTNDCAICDGPRPFNQAHTLESHLPQYDLSGDLGVQDVLVIKGAYYQGSPNYEKFYYAKNWGWVKWELYTDNQKVDETTFNVLSGQATYPQTKCHQTLPAWSLPTPISNCQPAKYFTQLHCQISTARQTGGSCQINPDLPYHPLEQGLNFWRWQYCY